MHAGQTVWFGSEEERRGVTRWYGVFAALAWALLEIFFELLFGPHLRLVRALAIGAGLGAAAGLFASMFQWLMVRHHIPDAGRLIPATTAGWTLAGLSGAVLLYALNQRVEFYRWNLPLQGAAAAFIAGLVGAGVPWVVLRQWAVARTGGRRWGASALCGTALGAACAYLFAFALIGQLGANADARAWPDFLLSALLGGGLLGGTVYGGFITTGLRRVLPGASADAPQVLPTPSRQVRPASADVGRDRGTPPMRQARAGSYLWRRVGPHHAARGHRRLPGRARTHVSSPARQLAG
jgi:hypothetical protein